MLLGCGRTTQAPAPQADAGAVDTSSPVDSLQVDASYGTLSFRGRIDRIDRGSEYEYRPHIDVTFHSNGTVNRTPVVNLLAYRFAATVPGEANGPWQSLHEESRPISIHLTEDNQTAHLPELRFRLPKTIAANARHVGLAVVDGHFMWPIAVELK